MRLPTGCLRAAVWLLRPPRQLLRVRLQPGPPARLPPPGRGCLLAALLLLLLLHVLLLLLLRVGLLPGPPVWPPPPGRGCLLAALPPQVPRQVLLRLLLLPSASALLQQRYQLPPAQALRGGVARWQAWQRQGMGLGLQATCPAP